MNFKSYFGLIGCLLVIAGGMSPMLHIPIIGNWNYWDVDTVLASVVYVFAATGLLGVILRKPTLIKFSGWSVLIVVAFTLMAVYFKVNDYFSFIPFKKLARIAAHMVHYRWLGWGMLFSGALIMIISSRMLAKKR